MKTTIGMLLICLIFVPALHAEPPDEQWISCDAETACPDEMQCVKFEDMPTAVCWPADRDPCEYCAGAECAVLESYPPQVICGGGEEVEPIACTEDGDCPENMICFDGYCVGGADPGDATTCKNEAGYCVIGETSGYCECITGEGTAWSEAEPVDPENPGDGETPPQPFFLPTTEECSAKLVEICGEKAPDVKDFCGKELFEACLDAVKWVNGTCFETKISEEEQAALDRGEWVGEWSQMVYQCCQETTLEEIATDLEELQQCVAEKSCDECLDGGDDVKPSLPCQENADCGEGGTCVDGQCQWEEVPVSGGEEQSDSDAVYTATGDDQTKNGESASTPKESSGSGCSLILL